MQSIRKRNKKGFTPLEMAPRAAGFITGFTLIELLIVTALLAVVSLAVYATFNNGLRIWQKINEQAPEEDLDIFLEKFSLDLRNTFKFSGFNFLGERQRIEFITFVDSPRMRKNTVGRVIYFYDPSSKIINKSSLDFSQIYDGNEWPAQQLARGVESLRFQYYFYDKGTKEYLWLDEWSKEGLPLAVRIELGFLEGTQNGRLIKTISIPVSN